METQNPPRPVRARRIARVIAAVLALMTLAAACGTQAEIVAAGREEPAAAAQSNEADDSPAEADDNVAPVDTTQTSVPAKGAADSSASEQVATTEATTDDQTTDQITDDQTVGQATEDQATDQASALPDALPVAAPTDVPVFGIDMHANGSQVVIDRIVHVPGETATVYGQIINGTGSLQFPRFDDEDTTRLTDSNGSSYRLIEGFNPDDGLINGETREFAIVFEAPGPDAGLLGVELNARFEDVGELDEIWPGFTIPPTMDFRNGNQAPPVPIGLPIFDVIAHPSGDIMTFDGLRFTTTHIAIGFSFTTDVASNGFYGDETFLTDDLGNRYGLVFKPDDRRWNLRGGEIASGYLVFGGRVHPDATSLSLTVNSRGTVNSESFGTGALFTPDPWNLNATFAPQTRITPVVANTNIVHPNATDVTLHRIDFEQARSVASVTAIYTGDQFSVELNAPGNDSYLLDNLGNRYQLQAPAGNKDLTIKSSEGFEAQLTFNGRIDSNASAVTLVLNDDNNPEAFSSTTKVPQFDFGPFPLNRQEAGAEDSGAGASAIPAEFGIWTVVNFGEIAESQAQELSLLVSEFDGIEICCPEGVRLTLPEGILFDFDKSDLRPEAQETVAKLIEILAYYEGDAVTIIGHTDSRGSDEYNQALSDDRASSVTNALIAGGVSADLLSADGRGETDPVASNDSDDGRQENRRVEVEIITDKGLPR